MFGKLKSIIVKEKGPDEHTNHTILFATTDSGTVHMLKCPALMDNPVRIVTIEGRHFFFCPICGVQLGDSAFVDAVEEKKRRDEELNAVYAIG